jgi:hypothetical protein
MDVVVHAAGNIKLAPIGMPGDAIESIGHLEHLLLDWWMPEIS